MTDDELVRAAMALPGASRLQRAGSTWVDSDGVRMMMVPAKSGGLSLVVHVFDARDGYAPGQHERGMDWTDITPDPHDDGNGGIALSLLGDSWIRVERTPEGVAILFTDPAVGRRWTSSCASLFLAACEVANTLGRWPGGEG